MKPLRVIVLVGTVSLMGYLGYKYETAPAAGYCQSQGRYIPNEEFINTAKDLFEWRVYHRIKCERPGEFCGCGVDSPGYKYFDKRRYSSDGYYFYRYSEHHPIWAKLIGKEEIVLSLFVGECGSDGIVYFYFDKCGHLVDGNSPFMRHDTEFEGNQISIMNHPAIE
ncbi:MAG: hypothetical protein ACYC3N_11050 [Halothiobacillus sp.]